MFGTTRRGSSWPRTADHRTARRRRSASSGMGPVRGGCRRCCAPARCAPWRRAGSTCRSRTSRRWRSPRSATGSSSTLRPRPKASIPTISCAGRWTSSAASVRPRAAHRCPRGPDRRRSRCAALRSGVSAAPRDAEPGEPPPRPRPAAGRAAQPGAGPRDRVRRLPGLSGRGRLPVHRLEHRLPARPCLRQAVQRGRGPGRASAPRYSASMAAGAPSKLALGKRVAAAIGYIGLCNFDRVGVTAFASGQGPSLARLRGRARAFDLLRFLDGLEPAGRTDLEHALTRRLGASGRRGLLVVISDLLNPRGYSAALLHARHHRFQTFLVHILADEEIAPQLAGDLRLIDVETGRALELTVDADALRAYVGARDAYFRDLETFCFRHGIDYVRTTSSVPADVLVLRYLRQGGLVR